MAELNLERSTSKNIRDDVKYCKAASKTASSSMQHQVSASRKRKSVELNEFLNSAAVVSTEVFVAASHNGDAPKRLNCQTEKDWKLDHSRARLCGSILQKLMTHRNGWVFNRPVDPVKQNIPDYFSVIAKPMDLGTIKTKLENHMYSTTHQFAADVKLTFSNAMTYNPSFTQVHVMAKELDGRFAVEWEMVELKWSKESFVPTQTMMNRMHEETIASEHVIKRKNSLSSHSRRSLKPVEKLKLKKDLEKVPLQSMPPKLLNFLTKASLLGSNKGKNFIKIDTIDERTLWQLHHIMRITSNERPLNTASGTKKDAKCSIQNLAKGGSDVEHEGPVCVENFTKESKVFDIIQHDFNSRGTAQRDKKCSDLDGEQDFSNLSNGVIDGEKPQPISHPYKPLDVMTKGLGEAICEIQLSPSKALRAAKLKSRFVDIILKAQMELHNNGEKHGPCRTQQERQKLARKHQEEKARIEAQAKAAAQKAEFDLKLKIEKERQAARIALQKIETSVVVDDFNQVVKELADLGYSEPLNFQMSSGMSGFTNPLRQLGFFLKEDDDDFDDEAMPAFEDADREEGEFCSSPRMFL